MNWLFNFSASPSGGGFRRLEETAKWFDRQGGAVFLVRANKVDQLRQYSACNRFVGVQQNKLERLLADGAYLPEVVQEFGTPDVYFSYGIPLFRSIGRLNWLHINNALTLTRDRHGMPLRRYLELQLLGNRMARSLRHAEIASAESEYALALLRHAGRNVEGNRRLVVIHNGCDDVLFERPDYRQELSDTDYAMTVGTWPYKRLDRALRVFEALQARQPSLKTFKIVGDRRPIPRVVLGDRRVETLGSGIENDELYCLLEHAKYYISTSGIENSSIAATEGILLAKKVVLSDIPSHREAVAGLRVQEFLVPKVGRCIEVVGVRSNRHASSPSWSNVLLEMVNIAESWHQYSGKSGPSGSHAS